MDWEEGIDRLPSAFSPSSISFQSIKNVVSSIRSSSNSGVVYEYIEKSRQDLNVIIEKEKENLSEEIYQEIKEFLNSG